MLRLLLAAVFLVVLSVDSEAKSPGICEGAFAKAATVKTKTRKFNAKKLACRTLRDGPKGFQLQCLGKPDSRVVSDRIAAGWSICMIEAGFKESIQGKNDRMKITELRDPKRGILCTMINSAPEPGLEGWSVKMKCFGPR